MHKARKKITYLLIFIILLVTITGCSSKEYTKYSYEFFGTFDTIIQVMGYTGSEKEFNKYAKHAQDRFNELHQMFDIYENYEGINNIKTINDNAGIMPVKVSWEIIELIELSIKYNKEISDKVNIAMGPVLNIWHTYREEGIYKPQNAKIPPIDKLQQKALLTDINEIIIDSKNSTVYLPQEGMMLDVGAIAKGFSTQLVAQELKELGLKSFLISSGGNVKVVGEPLDGIRKTWGIGIQNPYYFDDSDNQEQLIDSAFVNNTSIVSSGDYQRFYYVDRVRYHHLISPDTLMPATYYNAVTIMTQDSALADFLSTAIYLMPYDEGRAMVDSLDGVEAYWVFTDHSVKATNEMISVLKILGGAVAD